MLKLSTCSSYTRNSIIEILKNSVKYLKLTVKTGEWLSALLIGNFRHISHRI